VEFETSTQVGLGFFKMEQELSEILGRKVDLNTAGFLSQYFREKVILFFYSEFRGIFITICNY